MIMLILMERRQNLILHHCIVIQNLGWEEDFKFLNNFLKLQCIVIQNLGWEEEGEFRGDTLTDIHSGLKVHE